MNMMQPGVQQNMVMQQGNFIQPMMQQPGTNLMQRSSDAPMMQQSMMQPASSSASQQQVSISADVLKNSELFYMKL